jgi:hypothetical protein
VGLCHGQFVILHIYIYGRSHLGGSGVMLTMVRVPLGLGVSDVMPFLVQERRIDVLDIDSNGFTLKI